MTRHKGVACLECILLLLTALNIDVNWLPWKFAKDFCESAKIVVYLRVVMWECEMASCKRKYEFFREIEHLRQQPSASLSRWTKAHM